MKIMRVKFETIGGTDGDVSYYFDSPYNEEITAQENCDARLRDIVAKCESKAAIPAMLQYHKKDTGDNAKDRPVIVNSGLIPILVITDVVVYSDEKVDSSV
jgi:redox-regulated HSP33 family molecular chaperone